MAEALRGDVTLAMTTFASMPSTQHRQSNNSGATSGVLNPTTAFFPFPKMDSTYTREIRRNEYKSVCIVI